MPSLENQPPAATPPTRFRLLVTAHVLGSLTIVAAAFVAPGIGTTWIEHAWFIVTASQFSLLAIWTGFGGGSTRRRFACAALAVFVLILGSAGVVAATAIAMNWSIVVVDWYSWLALSGFNRVGRFFLVCVILLFVRSRIMRIGLVESDGATAAAYRLQYRLWHLMAVTVVAAIIVVAGQNIHKFFGQGIESIHSDPISFVVYNLMFLIVGLIYSLTIVFLALWATLGVQRPLLSIGAALLLAGMLSPIWPFLSRQATVGFALQVMVTSYQTLLVIASLLVVRSSGYRLISHNDAAVLGAQVEEQS